MQEQDGPPRVPIGERFIGDAAEALPVKLREDLSRTPVREDLSRTPLRIAQQDRRSEGPS
jgi:hypothetical protein